MDKFELHVADTDVSGGNISVGWCVPPSLLKLLSDSRTKDPQVVICVAPAENYHPKKEYRKVVPLKDLLAYVEFRASGENNIWAFVTSRSAKGAKNCYLSRTEGAYDTDILSHDGSEWSWGQKNVHDGSEFSQALPVSVLVPSGCFAPEPSELEKTWVNWLFRDKCVDQCAFRRRRLFAYTAQLVIFSAMMVLYSLITLGALLFGARNFSWKIAKPLNHSPSNMMEMFEMGTIFMPRYVSANTLSEKINKYWKLPFMPAMMLAIFGFVYLLGKAGILTLFPFVFVGIAMIALGAYLLVEKIIKPAIDRQADEALELWYLKEEEAALMMCAPGKRLTKLSDLPKEKRTLKLRFLDLKSKVCRPFSA